MLSAASYRDLDWGVLYCAGGFHDDFSTPRWRERLRIRDPNDDMDSSNQCLLNMRVLICSLVQILN
jgi:hypothetical protein